MVSDISIFKDWVPLKPRRKLAKHPTRFILTRSTVHNGPAWSLLVYVAHAFIICSTVSSTCFHGNWVSFSMWCGPSFWRMQVNTCQTKKTKNWDCLWIIIVWGFNCKKESSILFLFFFQQPMLWCLNDLLGAGRERHLHCFYSPCCWLYGSVVLHLSSFQTATGLLLLFSEKYTNIKKYNHKENSNILENSHNSGCA